MQLNLYQLQTLYYPEVVSNGLEYLKSYNENELNKFVNIFMDTYKGSDTARIKKIESDYLGGSFIIDDKFFMKMKIFNIIDPDNPTIILNEINNEAIVARELEKINIHAFPKMIAYGQRKINYPELTYKENPTAISDIIIYPKITGMSIIEYLKIGTYSEIIHVFRQMIYSLYEANSKNGFTHNDLHVQNVMVSPKNLFETYDFKYESLKKNIKNTKNVHIIDFGASYVDTAPTGQEWTEAGQRMVSWWVHDIVKIWKSVV